MASLSILPHNVRKQIYQELINLIPSYAWPRYAVISKEMQAVVESFIFASLHLVTGDLQNFSNCLDSRRQGYLQNVTLLISLPTYSHQMGQREEDDEEHLRSSKTFNQAISSFLQVLAHWDPEKGPQSGLHLTLNVNSISDETSTSFHHRQRRRPSMTERARASVMQIDLAAAALPEVRVVTALTCQGRHIELLSVLTLMSKLKGLEELDIEFENDTKYDRDVEQRRRMQNSPLLFPTCDLKDRILIDDRVRPGLVPLRIRCHDSSSPTPSTRY